MERVNSDVFFHSGRTQARAVKEQRVRKRKRKRKRRRKNTRSTNLVVPVQRYSNLIMYKLWCYIQLWIISGEMFSNHCYALALAND